MRRYYSRHKCPACVQVPAYTVTRRADGVVLCAYCRNEGIILAQPNDLANIRAELAKLNPL